MFVNITFHFSVITLRKICIKNRKKTGMFFPIPFICFFFLFFSFFFEKHNWVDSLGNSKAKCLTIDNRALQLGSGGEGGYWGGIPQVYPSPPNRGDPGQFPAEYNVSSITIKLANHLGVVVDVFFEDSSAEVNMWEVNAKVLVKAKSLGNSFGFPKFFVL